MLTYIQMALKGGRSEWKAERKRARDRVCTKERQSEGGGYLGSAECTEEY